MQLDKQEIQETIDYEIQQGIKKFGKEFKFTAIRIIGLIEQLHPVNQEYKSVIIPLADWNKYHPYPTVKAMRCYYSRRAENGFEYCVEYGGENGGRILINEDKFNEWRNDRTRFKKAI